MAHFPCPSCGAQRTDASADCPDCDWKSRASAEGAGCPSCGGSTFERGFLQGHHNVKFKSNDVGFLERYSVLGGLEVKARRCSSCGLLSLFA